MRAPSPRDWKGILPFVSLVLLVSFGAIPLCFAFGALYIATKVFGGLRIAQASKGCETPSKEDVTPSNVEAGSDPKLLDMERVVSDVVPNLTGSAAILARLKEQRSKSQTVANRWNQTDPTSIEGLGNGKESNQKILNVLHGGQAATEVASELVEEARKEGILAQSIPMNEFKSLKLEKEPTWCIFIIETVENAQPAEGGGSCVRYFNRKKKNGESNLLRDKLRYAVIALGDTNLLLDRQTTTARDCNQAGQVLDAALSFLGAKSIVSRCEANDAVGFEEALLPWRASLWDRVRSSMREVCQTTTDNKEARELLILYGSQTGNAAEIAKNLGAECTSKGISNQVLEMQEAGGPTDVWKPGCVTLVVVSSTGDGDPPDNCATFYARLKRRSNPPNMLEGVQFAVLGLGDQNYTAFMAVPRAFHRRMEELGAQAFLPRMEIDEVEGIEHQLDHWSERFWPALQEILHARTVGELQVDGAACQQVTQASTDLQDFQESVGRLVGVPPRPTLRIVVQTVDQCCDTLQQASDEVHQQYNVPVSDCLLLTNSSSDRRVLHLEFDVSNTGLEGAFNPGDSIGIQPCNNNELVTSLLERLDYDPDVIFTVGASLESEKEKHLLPHIKTPCTVRDCFMKYLDVTSVPRKSFLRLLAEYCSDNSDKLKLMELSSKGGRELYKQQIQEAQPGLLDILNMFKSCRPSLDCLIDSMPPLTPRLYSITNSPLYKPSNIQVAFSVVDYTTQGGYRKRGVATTWLDKHFGPSQRRVASSCSIFLKSGGHFALPEDPSIPIIMVGPGTGVAPFRGFLQHRMEQAKRTGSPSGEMWLFYGCRKRSEDYLYGDELEGFQRQGAVRLIVAFSREQQQKVYVQDKMLQYGDTLNDLIRFRMAHIYICGDGSRMARDVHACLEKILVRGGLTQPQSAAELARMTKEGRYIRDIWS